MVEEREKNRYDSRNKKYLFRKAKCRRAAYAPTLHYRPLQLYAAIMTALNEKLHEVAGADDLVQQQLKNEVRSMVYNMVGRVSPVQSSGHGAGYNQTYNFPFP